ncbi:MAG: ABC transporter permease [Nocardioidaceae bacterium]|nr:ABC transporter permease [Nocardioidaceae bacterium]
MFGYLLRRVISGILVLLAVSFVLFTVFAKGPAQPALAYCSKGVCTAEQLDIIERNLGLDQPLLQQYGTYIKGVVAGREINSGTLSLDCNVPCLGYSFKKFEMVTPFLLDRFPATLSIALGASVVFLTVGVAVGVISARNRGKPLDRGLQGFTMLATAIPYYLVALLAFLFLVSKWGLFPTTEYVAPFAESFSGWFKGMLLAWLVLGLFYTTAYVRYSRGSMVEALNEDYVRTARAKGLTDRRVALKHALRAALVPVVTIFGLDFATILAGTIFTERIFNIQGIGLEALQSIGQQDLPVISATVLIAATFVVVSNIVVDVAYAALDPRVRL